MTEHDISADAIDADDGKRAYQAAYRQGSRDMRDLAAIAVFHWLAQIGNEDAGQVLAASIRGIPCGNGADRKFEKPADLSPVVLAILHRRDKAIRSVVRALLMVPSSGEMVSADVEDAIAAALEMAEAIGLPGTEREDG